MLFFVKFVLYFISKNTVEWSSLINQIPNNMNNYLKLVSKFCVFLLFLFGCENLHSQSRFDHNHSVSIGTGLFSLAGATYYSNLSQNENFEALINGGFHLKYEYRLSEKFSMGITYGYVEVQGSWTGTEANYIYQWGSVADPNSGSFSVYSTSIVGRFNWSLMKKEKVEVYVGAGAGYRIENISENIVDEELYGVEKSELGPPISVEGSFGFRYYVIPSLGFYTEVGIAKSFFQVGLVFGF